jgi:hypothetical protein
MKNAALRMLAMVLYLPACVGCQAGGTFLRDTVDVMATPVLWLSKKDDTRSLNKNSSFNSDSWTANQWGPNK